MDHQEIHKNYCHQPVTNFVGKHKVQYSKIVIYVSDFKVSSLIQIMTVIWKNTWDLINPAIIEVAQVMFPSKTKTVIYWEQLSSAIVLFTVVEVV